MFASNKYSKWYFNIIEVAKNRKINGYTETHHIIPKCLNGDDSKNNLVSLTAREHFICHLLLTKMHSSRKLKYALICLTLKNPHQQLRYVPNSRMYENLKKLNSELAKERFTGNQKHNVGKKRAYDPITHEVRMFSENEIPNGWILGNSPEMKKNQSGKNAGKVYYHDPNTKETIALSKDEEIPLGFIKGNPNASTSPAKNTVMCYNPKTLENKRVVGDIPEGWIKGSSLIWINNGIESKQFVINTPLPEGWVKGRLNWR